MFVAYAGTFFGDTLSLTDYNPVYPTIPDWYSFHILEQRCWIFQPWSTYFKYSMLSLVYSYSMKPIEKLSSIEVLMKTNVGYALFNYLNLWINFSVSWIVYIKYWRSQYADDFPVQIESNQVRPGSKLGSICFVHSSFTALIEFLGNIEAINWFRSFRSLKWKIDILQFIVLCCSIYFISFFSNLQL